MSWTEIKKALNSTLGTEKFEPLDAMLERIYDNYHIVPTGSEIGKDLKEYTVRYNGTIRAVVKTHNSKSYAQSGTAIITLNGKNTEHAFSIPGNTYASNTFDVIVKKGDVIKLDYESGGTTLYLEEAYWLGGVVGGEYPISLIE